MERIETGLYMEVDQISVHYGRIPHPLCPEGWHDLVYFIQTDWQEGKENHEAIVEKIVRQLESQSYDHGSEWRETNREVIKMMEMTQISLVSFRIRDSY